MPYSQGTADVEAGPVEPTTTDAPSADVTAELEAAQTPDTSAPDVNDVADVEESDSALGGQSDQEGWWLPLILLVPGIAGLWIAAIKDASRSASTRKETPKEAEALANDEAKTQAAAVPDNQFLVAALAGTVWALTLAAIVYLEAASAVGGELNLLHKDLNFPLYVPVLGFLGALLYVLDLSRRGREDIPKGTEFGMRLIMGPYVAIVMVALFGQDLGFVQLDTELGQGALAFFSGLLVVLAFQGLAEKGQEILGAWRDKARYTQSEIAKHFELTKDEDLTFRKAGLRHLLQLRQRTEARLHDDAKRFGIDEDLLIGMKQVVERQRLRQAIGDLAWGKLAEQLKVKSLEDFAHLTDMAFDQVGSADQSIDVANLKTLRNEAKEFALPRAA